MSKIKQGTIKELKFDPQNANRGTERGNQDAGSTVPDPD